MDEVVLAEQMFIGALMFNPTWLDECSSVVKSEYFHNKFLASLYEAILELKADSESIDLTSVSQKAESERHGKMEIAKHLAKMQMETVAGNALTYANSIVENFKQKQFIEIVRLAPDVLTRNVDTEIDLTILKLKELQELRRTSKVKTIAEIMDEYRYTYFNPEYDPHYFHLGFPGIDDSVGGIEDGSLTCIASRPAVGKSAFVGQIADEKSRYDKIAFFSLEMTEKQILDRTLSYHSGLSVKRLKNGKEFLGDEKGRFHSTEKMIQENSNFLLFTVPETTNGKISSIKAICKTIEGLRVIIIDYLQLLVPETKRGNRREEVGDISKALKRMALELKIPVIVLSQLNRTSDQRPDREPVMSDLRESGDIEQDCDNIFLLWNIDEKEDRSRKGFKTEKVRNGTTDRYELRFNGALMSFSVRGKLSAAEQPVEDTTTSKDGFMELPKDLPDEMPFA